MEYFVFTVRSYVGLEIFVNAVGIGKGKCDLTTFAFKQVKKKKKIISVPRVTRRKSKAFSSFTSGDIINYLTGGSRLSKTKSSDLFWEAVWPCLVAKGWNSMNIKGNLSKNHLVFLVPGIKMFSKKIHKKGTHYFDSISDILNKVAAEPSLLEQNAECSKGKVEGEPSTRKPRAKASKRSKNTNGENFNPPVAKKKRSVAKRSKKKQRLSSEPEKITVVDTSAAQGEEGVLELTQLRTLPIMKKGNSKGLCLSSAKPATQPMNENNLCDQFGKVYSRKMKSMVSDVPGPSSKRRRLASFHHVITHPQPVLIVAQAKTHIVNVEPAPEMPALSPFTDKVTAENAASRPILDLNMPTIEVNVAIIDLNMPIIDVNVPIIDLDMPSIDVNMPIIDLNMPSIDVNMPIIDLNMPSIDGNVPIIDLNMPVIVDDLSPPLMDLNIPPLIDLTVLPDIDLNSTPPAPEPSDAAETLLAEACQGLLDLNSSPEEGKGFFDLNSYPDEEESQPEEQEQLLMDSQVVEEANVELSSPMPAPNARRQSTRTRPPTLKAIEAAAYGYISPERSERAMKAPKLSSASSKGSRQATKKKGSKLM
ncbi:hypothetical protein IHE45_12G020500 [Dioscorea alata]|uniref:Uncharacterized protein n=1 Tax=Dioscorea alata TaxID=55571 RepID=A0ACB7V0U4_DIOAL|nr:hypothetical protein IHE45_12G020500 [Dioscorea alata]